MAVIVPIMAMYAGVTAGMAMAAGAAVTIGGALAVAGGMLGALGLIANDKKLQRTSGMFTLASGLLGGLGSTAANASAGSIEAADAVYAGADTAGAAGAAGGATTGQAAGAAQAGVAAAPQAAGAPADGMLPGTENGFETSMAQAKPSAAPAAAEGGSSALQDAALTQRRQDVQTMLARQQEMAAAQGGQQLAPAQQLVNPANNPQSYTPGGNSLMDVGRGVSSWVRQNPLLAQMGFQTVAGMYGPESERMDFQRSLYERARANANSPVRMGYYPATKPAGG